jgi:transcriptional regulator with PAS, ATPase and Fis domain
VNHPTHDNQHILHASFSNIIQFETIPLLIIDAKQHDNPIILCNKAFSRLDGRHMSDIAGKNLHQTLKADPDAFRNFNERAPSALTVLRHGENKDAFACFTFIMPIRNVRGETVYSLAAQLDVSGLGDDMALLEQLKRDVVRRTRTVAALLRECLYMPVKHIRDMKAASTFEASIRTRKNILPPVFPHSVKAIMPVMANSHRLVLEAARTTP